MDADTSSNYYKQINILYHRASNFSVIDLISGMSDVPGQIDSKIFSILQPILDTERNATAVVPSYIATKK
jgi:hypothetical protein